MVAGNTKTYVTAGRDRRVHWSSLGYVKFTLPACMVFQNVWRREGFSQWRLTCNDRGKARRSNAVDEQKTPGQVIYEAMSKVGPWSGLDAEIKAFYESAADVFMDWLDRESASGQAIDDIHKMLAYLNPNDEPDWEYPGQIVRDVAKALGVADRMGEILAAPANAIKQKGTV